MHTFSFPHRVAETALQVEAWGFAGLFVGDSQNLNADVWMELALAGAVTKRILLGPGVTNPVTRHPAVTASATLTLQAETGGRSVLGIGRGDTALTQIGRQPVSVETLEKTVVALQRLLQGEEASVDGAPGRIGWIPENQPKVPLSVAATGPRVIALAAEHAEAVDFAVGSEHARLSWAIETARAAAGDRAPSLGAFLNVAVHPDRAVARDLVRGSAAILARFPTEAAPPAAHAQQLEDEFLDRFALAGPAEEVVERLAEVAALGIERIIVIPGSLDADPGLVAEANARFAEEVLPHLAALG
jgi:5,10-methylenetetrahydromethanopterin reductase